MDTSCPQPVPKGTRKDALSRRNLLKIGAAGAVTAAASRFSLGQTAPAYAQTSGPQSLMSFAPHIASSKYSLVDRLTFGKNAQEMALFDKLGWSAYLEYHLAPTKIDDTACNNAMLEYPTLDATPYQALRTYTFANGYDVFGDLTQSNLLRQVYSNRQLQEVMTEFWLDHFNIYVPATWYQFLPQFVKMIRANALGSFSTLLNGVVRSGAMLLYLNNTVNDRYNHNENFARELLELHTLGAYQGYTEADIYVARRCLTGWNFVGFYTVPWQNTTNANWGQFQYYPEHHDNEGGVFMGSLIPKGDMQQGLTILAKIANHPNTAIHISTKLIKRFVTETPSQAFVTAAANVFTSTSGDITAVLRYILGQTVFTANASPKFKRPSSYTLSILRATNADVSVPKDVLYNVLLPMGQLPFYWPRPDGYPDQYLNWSDDLLPRWRFAVNLIFDGVWGARMDPFPFMGSRTTAGVVAYINNAYYGGTLPVARQTALKTYLGAANPTNQKILEAISIALAYPEFQWR